MVNIQGFVFLGMVTQLTTHLRKVLEEQPSIRPVVLDFARVSRLDTSAIATIRLRTFAEGALVGEIASCAGLPRTADVVAQTDTSVYRVPFDTLHRLHEDNPRLASALHRVVASTLADKLDGTNKLLGKTK